MSHFVVMVAVAGSAVEAARGDLQQAVTPLLAPYHEFECTGVNDEYVVNVDDTEELRDDYAKATETRMKRLSDGALIDPFDDNGNYKPEFAKPHPDTPSNRTLHVPEGYEQVDVPASTVENFIDWAADWTGREVVIEGETPLDLETSDGGHKYGHILVRRRAHRRAINTGEGDTGAEVEHPDYELVRTIDRTNPDKKWDWWVIGGRWSGYFRPKGTEGDPNVPASMQGLTQDGNSIRKGDWPFEARLADETERYGRYYDDVRAVLDLHPDTKTWKQILAEATPEGAERPVVTDEVRAAYNTQPGVIAANAVLRFDATEEDKTGFGGGRVITGWGDGIDDFMVPREKYAAQKAWAVAGAYAMLDEDGWHQKGDMGWFGVSLNEDDDWHEKGLARLRAYDDDTVLVIVDCHI